MFVKTTTSAQINLLFPSNLPFKISIKAKVGKSKINEMKNISKMPIDKNSVVIL